MRQPDPFHNGGRLQVGRNGRLYVGLGDGGGVCDPNGLAQKLWRRHGSLLSLDPRRLAQGWRVASGTPTRGGAETCPDARLRGPGRRVLPITVYGRKAGCAVIGGHVYWGRALKRQRGWYFFGDHCTGRIWRLLYRDGEVTRKRRLVVDSDLRLTSVGEGVNGEIHVTDRDGGVYRLVR